MENFNLILKFLIEKIDKIIWKKIPPSFKGILIL